MNTPIPSKWPTIEEFLSASPIARKAHLSSQIVFRRTSLSLVDVARGREAGEIRIKSEPLCELEIGGVIVALGELVVQEGRRMFQVLQVHGEAK